MAEFEARGRHVRLPMEISADGDAVRVEGYAAVFDQEADIGGFFRERIAPGAFTDAIGRDDVVFLFNHDPDTLMARTRSGTLTLMQDDKGLKMSAALDPSDPDVQRVYRKMQRGDLDKMSFAFIPEVEEWDDTGDLPLRTIKRASLHDVSAVTTPAYDGTAIGLRSLSDYRKAQRAHNFNRAKARRQMMAAGLSRRGL
jgi:HK97 family phage prohead protease